MKLPTSTGDLPTSREPWDEDVSYRGVIRKLDVAENLDKAGGQFLKCEIEVTEPEARRGEKIRDNYIAIPMDVDDDMEEKQRRRAMERGVRLGRLSQSAKLNTDDTDDFVGAEVAFTVSNEEYPEGSGQMVPRVKDYLI